MVNKRRGNGAPSLSEDIFRRIFEFLPPRSLAVCCLVCTHWNKIINSSSAIWNTSFLRQKRMLDILCRHEYASCLWDSSPKEGAWKPQTIYHEHYARLACGSASTRVWKAHSGRINCCSILFDRIVSASSDKRIRIWSTKNLQSLEEYHVPGRAPIVGLLYDGGRIIAAAGKEVYIWQRGRLHPNKKLGGHNHEFHSMCFFDPEIAVGCSDGSIQFLDMYSNRCSLLLKYHTGPVTCVAPSAGSSMIVSGSNDGTVQLSDSSSGQQIASFSVVLPPVAVTCLQVVQNHKIMVGTSSGDVFCLDIRRHKSSPLWKSKVTNNTVYCMHTPEYGAVLGVGGISGILQMLDVCNGKLLRSYDRDNYNSGSCRGRSPIVSLMMGMRNLVTSHADGTLALWNYDYRL